MKSEQQRIAIATACGWTTIRECTCGKVPRGVDPSGKDGHLPDFLNDLNAMHEAEKVLTREQRIDYLERLSELTGSYADAVYAAAAQRAEAFLRAIDKWEGQP